MLFNFTFFVCGLAYSPVTFHVSTLVVSHSQDINKKDVNREYQNFCVATACRNHKPNIIIYSLDPGDPSMGWSSRNTSCNLQNSWNRLDENYSWGRFFKFIKFLQFTINLIISDILKENFCMRPSQEIFFSTLNILLFGKLSHLWFIDDYSNKLTLLPILLLVIRLVFVKL